MQRVYKDLLTNHLTSFDQALFLSGPRQVGKTTLARAFVDSKATKYLNWDNLDERTKILGGNKKIVEDLPLDVILKVKPLIILDEVHKYKHWRLLVKSLLDSYKGRLNIIVTGSAKLDMYNQGKESLMGRYFSYRIHPLSVREITKPEYSALKEDQEPTSVKDETLNSLLEYGGFPDPFIKQNKLFSRRWHELRNQQLFREDIKDLASIQELMQLEVLAKILKEQAGNLVNYTNLSRKVRVSDQTIRRWINVLEAFYFCFTIRPWSENISRSLIKEPKIYLTDWSILENGGAKIENFVASHLLKSINFWSDLGLGEYNLHFIRDKEKKEVDFLVVKDRKPWLMLEVKTSYKEQLSETLLHFQNKLQAPYAFQVASDLEFEDIDCFALKEPRIVPLSTFLSQLV